MHLAFITNNASRPPEAVVEKLAGIGVARPTADVVTSAQAAARVLADQLRRRRAGSPCSAAAGLEEALRAEGLEPVAVGRTTTPWRWSTGYGPDVVWRDVMRAAMRVRDGLPWVASNADLSLPTPFGEAPGHGVMVGPAGAVRRGQRGGGGQAAASAAGRDRTPGGRATDR